MSHDILTRYRTKVIEDFIMIEGYVNAIICKHYLGHINREFMLEVLFDELCGAGFKANVLEKVLQNKNLVGKPHDLAEKFRQMSRIRNYFAHCNTAVFEGISEESGGGVPHPRKPHGYLDVEKEKEKFFELVQFLGDSLIEAMDQMGVIFIHDTDTGVLSIACEEPHAGETT